MTQNATWRTLPFFRTGSGLHHRLVCVVSKPDEMHFCGACGTRVSECELVWCRTDADVQWCKKCQIVTHPWTTPVEWADEDWDE